MKPYAKILATVTFFLAICLTHFFHHSFAFGSSSAKLEASGAVTLTTSNLLLILIFAIVLFLVHLRSGRIWHTLHHSLQDKSQHHLRPETIASSLGGGIAAAYVFLHLIPELIQIQAELAHLYGYTMLAGLMLFHGLEYLADRMASHRSSHEWDFIERKMNRHKLIFPLHISFLFFYNGLIIYTIPKQIHISLLRAVIYVFAMAIHLLSDDYFLEERYRRQFNQWGRYVLAAAPLVGWLAVWLTPANEILSGILIAALVGFILVNVFQEQLRNDENSSYIWFLTGVLLFALLLFLAD
ncbi:MAG: hypothetical protein AB4426_04120 [Xenococcaceae cyanobacterium]